MARLLIFDTSGGACSVAVWSGGGLAAERFEAMAHGQAERLLPMIGEALAAAGIGYGELDAVGVTRGPGAFTGIRIGLAAARGLALALDIPAIGIATFEALAVRAPAGCVVAIDTRRNDFYCQRFGPDGAARDAPEILPAAGAAARAGAAGVPLVTDSAALAAGVDREPADPPPAPPRAAEFAALVAGRHDSLGESGRTGLPPPRPLYLRPPKAQLSEARQPEARQGERRRGAPRR
ncbi:MAG: tRNA (adenosine(37)-N6)-threonylcarbamoyltransferase complex dimerization subunit type 1 TsaB [Rhodospirillaceae bacterium]|nr:tRNA (adenosine(37)-N6)-threonylcarbamoyltransferase complex dimerization subunit type 1 TsaB [Rhodospirillaceae bacterium]MYB14780.1 tRNA (adenosine(37)-N6)-threonylcarbamoyltransferase complex dimerization subunit type 1 TsaB [Rhodospirillaceae bacterium]MYI50107.1 tRNA (adenosine(37)-N6)-threonylcarbamoyltransferase complex dimerization subunit type 1 TsaB [Rhodospirillaceae bacterium]